MNDINESAVVAYLQAHPEFFQTHQELLDELHIHHHEKGVLSLVEAKLQRQRDQLAKQQYELDTMRNIAEHNERMFFSLLPLQEQLSKSKTFTQGMTALQKWTTALGLLKGTVLIFRDSWVETDSIPSENWLDRSAFDIIRLERFGLKRHYLGKLTHREKTLMFLPTDFPLGSVAFCLLGKRKSKHPYTAVLVFSARDERHFHRSQDTTFLQQLADVVERQLNYWLIERIS
ncbi:DUF484 family protein [Spirabiliibacterium falconis]|uniref:DUF484 family protein n=1 Tax=Spirabiliibacterium falconis TaxID=572023 RepID=UPI001AAC88B9|nr:DUF484 family protein [Spirabiliibacterium falconis]MBE2894814.1 DUF484 family protein [Spirabiliibacterium falconis]